ncbi:MAG: DUF1259 domain-containing protein [Pseudomonadota bacterium]|nr:DUF1259 domain-containing protein [Pseudomonadota bacterium]
MNTRFAITLAISFFIVTGAVAAPNWQRVDAALGRSGAAQAGGIHRYSFPRSDLNVTLDGVRIRPALALGSWVAFQPHGSQAMVMGDLVLLHEEVNPVLSHLLRSGLTITALHNHLLRSAPGTMYMHIHGHGDPARLAAVIRSALELTRTPLGETGAAATEPMPLNSASVDRVLGATGKVNGGVLQYSIPRRETIRDSGIEVPASMGLGTVINLQPTTAGRAVTTGDFVLTASEVTPVLRALRESGIDVTALHNHLGQEEPRLFFMHFWGNGDAIGLARGLKRALDSTNVTAAARHTAGAGAG